MTARDLMHGLSGYAVYLVNIATWPLFPVIQGLLRATRWLRLKCAGSAAH